MIRYLASLWIHCGIVIGLQLASMVPAKADDALRFYIGTATNAALGGGIFQSTLSLSTGKMEQPKLAAATNRSTFLWIHPTLDVIYSVAELSQGEGAGKRRSLRGRWTNKAVH